MTKTELKKQLAGLHAFIIEKQLACLLAEEEIAIERKTNRKEFISCSLLDQLAQNKRELHQAMAAYHEFLAFGIDQFES